MLQGEIHLFAQTMKIIFHSLFAKIASIVYKTVRSRFKFQHKFTDINGNILNTHRAMFLSTVNSHMLFYKNIQFSLLVGSSTHSSKLSTINMLNEDKESLFVMCGYVEATDTFVFLKYDMVADPELDNIACLVCLESMNSRIHIPDKTIVPLRLWGPKCFHDVHSHCLEECIYNRVWFGQCCSQTSCQITFHMQVTAIVESKVTFSVFVEHGAQWQDIKRIPLSCHPNEAFEQVCEMYNSLQFVQAGKCPYSPTVDQFCSKAKRKEHTYVISTNNRVVPL